MFTAKQVNMNIRCVRKIRSEGNSNTDFIETAVRSFRDQSNKLIEDDKQLPLAWPLLQHLLPHPTLHLPPPGTHTPFTFTFDGERTSETATNTSCLVQTTSRSSFFSRSVERARWSLRERVCPWSILPIVTRVCHFNSLESEISLPLFVRLLFCRRMENRWKENVL